MPKSEESKQTLPVRWEELTATDFPEAVQRSQGVCVLPIGVMEKHGPHLPLGTDVMVAREVSVRAAAREYAVVFPSYWCGQIFEAKHTPGCLALSESLLTPLLQNVCDEIARNGFDKILLVNGHGGNNNWLNYFTQMQLERRREYGVYLVYAHGVIKDEAVRREIEARWQASGGEVHAEEVETSMILAIRPELVKLKLAGKEDSSAQKRLQHLPGVTTGIWWYADFPNHYAGDAQKASIELGERVLEATVAGLVDVIGGVKKDTAVAQLQDEFFRHTQQPLGERGRQSREK
ncbi:MAG: creatininase family protein [Armatimonadetes bacterium]|nr:creatininase family protein [Armatimonadota bacterium]